MIWWNFFFFKVIFFCFLYDNFKLSSRKGFMCVVYDVVEKREILLISWYVLVMEIKINLIKKCLMCKIDFVDFL